STDGFPGLSQWALRTVDRIVIRNWQSRDIVIGLWALARQTPKQIPLASIRVGSNNCKVRAGANILVSYTCWNYDHITGMHLDVLAMLAAEDRKSTRLNSSHQIISYAVFCLKKKTKKQH